MNDLSFCYHGLQLVLLNAVVIVFCTCPVCRSCYFTCIKDIQNTFYQYVDELVNCAF